MKKKYLTCAGIISALILVGIFIAIALTSVPSPFLLPATTIDPITGMNVDDNNMMILTGTTTLPIDSQIAIKVSASPHDIAGGNTSGKTTANGDAQIISGARGSSRWEGFVDISQLLPTEYTITLVTITYTENFTKIVESNPIATQKVTLGDEHSGPDSIRKKTAVKKQFIRLNAIDERETGERQRITGTTSLQPGTSLLWAITETGNETGSGIQSAQGFTDVIPGMEGINRWSVVCDTAHMKPARYRIRVSEDTGNNTHTITSDGRMSAVSDFSLIPPAPGIKNTTDAIRNSSRFVTIDTLPDMQINDIYRITGTTSLPVGEDLLVQVSPSSFMTDYNFTINPKVNNQEDVSSGATGTLSGANSMVKIVKGSGSENLWSFELRTYQMESGIYVVNISNDKFDYPRREPIPGDVSRSMKFGLKRGYQ
ncbi:hypothetical protein [uncultured Methanoregula sp.]|uniref:hypothetical protein n=1 Tax=uncultured Methanoregula sp. TaxID=1005933 RepID=UPI002AAA73FB|nr:hypothetical protein [uncultured Methanoregula sp.]